MKSDTNRRQSMAARDLLDQLQSDPLFVARAREKESRRSLAARSFARTAAPVVADLQRAGYRVESIDELRHSRKRYEDAVPILLHWLTRSPPEVQEDIVRTLSVPWARPAASQAMIEEFKKLPLATDPTGTGLRWAMGNALEVLADESIVDEMVKIVTEPRYGVARQMVVLGLARPRNRKVAGTLIPLLNDQDVAGHAAMALGRLRAPDARPALEALANNGSVPWFRREARKALRKLE